MAWPSSWTRAQRLVITVPAATVAPLPYFPVVLTAASLPTELTNNTYGRSDGGDLAFAADLGVGNSVSSIGAQIPCEVVSAAFGGTPSAEIHVQVPSVAATGTLTYLWVLYGNSGQTAQPAASSTYGSQAVWNENGTQKYAAIYHFGTSSTLSLADSTANTNTLSNGNSVTGGTGGFGGGAASWTLAAAQCLYNTSISLSQPTSFSVYVKRTDSRSNDFLFDGYATGGRQVLNTGSLSGTNVGFYAGTNLNGNSPFTGNWEQVGAVYNGASSFLYRSGAADLSNVNAGANSLSGLTIGSRYAGTGGSTQWFDGLIEEFRVSAVARSGSWFAAEWANWNAPGTFITPSGSAFWTSPTWYSTWTRAQRLAITVPAGTVAPLPYFPVVLTAASLPTELTNNTYGRSDGGDLAFAADLGAGNALASIGAQLPCEVVSASFGGSPSAEIHVQVPSVAATGTLTYIWVLYGNSGQTAQPAASSTYGSQKVWNENGTQNFLGVWHLQGTGTPATWADSTSNGYTGTNYSATAISAGEFGGAASFNGTSAYIDIGASTLYTFSTQSTLSAWGKTSNLHTSTLLCLQRSTGGSTAQSIVVAQNPNGDDQNNGIPGGRYRNAGAVITNGSVSIADGNWHYCVWIINGTNATLYVDNTSVATASDVNDSNTFTTSSEKANIGSKAGTSVIWNGAIDETRIASVARSASWLAADYANQSAPGTFIAPPGGQGPLPTLTFMPWIFSTEDC